MKDVSPWCIVINKRRVKSPVWNRWHSMLEKNHVPFTSHFTGSIGELSDVIAELLATGQRYFLFAGGDGTIHHGGNLLIYHAGDRSVQCTIGAIPSGTGNDWVRCFGVKKSNLPESLLARRSTPHHVLEIRWPDGSKRYAMNMLGGALDAAVVDSLNTKDYPVAGFLKYPIALLKTLQKTPSWTASIKVDDRVLSGEWLTIEAGFGKYCGGGMYVLPHAQDDKPALLLMKKKSFAKIILSLPKIYNGKIANQKEAIAMHFKKIEILESTSPIPLEADGEWLGYGPVSPITVLLL